MYLPARAPFGSRSPATAAGTARSLLLGMIGLSVVTTLVVGALVVGGCGAGVRKPGMRVDRPKGVKGNVPVAVYIHGGGWVEGNKVADAYYKAVTPQLLARGVAVVTIDYRLAPRHRFPTQMHDVTYAIRYLRSQARQMRIDPDRIAVFGTSAGGHLAALLGTADKAAGFEGGALPDVSSRVSAVATIAGPADLTAATFPPATKVAIQKTFGAGGPPPPATLAAASPVTHASAGDPPFLIVHGTADEVIPHSQSVELARKLKAAGVAAELVSVNGGTHALAAPGQSLSPEQITAKIASFLAGHLAPAPT
jgi:acetyl esterase/lipase